VEFYLFKNGQHTLILVNLGIFNFSHFAEHR
jgi:hypothetical protein